MEKFTTPGSFTNDESSEKIIAVKFITEQSHSKSGVCEQCQQFSGNIYFLSPDGTHDGPDLPLHPNCCCYYQYLTIADVYQQKQQSGIASCIPYFETASKGNTVHMRVKNSPGAFGEINFSLGDIEFEGFSDMMKKLKKEYSYKQIDTLIISNHGGLEGDYPLGNCDSLNRLNDTQISQLKDLLHPNATVDIRMCYTSGGKDGEAAAQRLANRLNCKILGYAGPVNYYGGRALYTKKDRDRKKSYFQHFFQDPKPKLFYPQLENNK